MDSVRTINKSKKDKDHTKRLLIDKENLLEEIEELKRKKNAMDQLLLARAEEIKLLKKKYEDENQNIERGAEREDALNERIVVSEEENHILRNDIRKLHQTIDEYEDRIANNIIESTNNFRVLEDERIKDKALIQKQSRELRDKDELINDYEELKVKSQENAFKSEREIITLRKTIEQQQQQLELIKNAESSKITSEQQEEPEQLSIKSELIQEAWKKKNEASMLNNSFDELRPLSPYYHDVDYNEEKNQKDKINLISDYIIKSLLDKDKIEVSEHGGRKEGLKNDVEYYVVGMEEDKCKEIAVRLGELEDAVSEKDLAEKKKIIVDFIKESAEYFEKNYGDVDNFINITRERAEGRVDKDKDGNILFDPSGSVSIKNEAQDANNEVPKEMERSFKELIDKIDNEIVDYSFIANIADSFINFDDFCSKIGKINSVCDSSNFDFLKKIGLSNAKKYMSKSKHKMFCDRFSKLYDDINKLSNLAINCFKLKSENKKAWLEIEEGKYKNLLSHMSEEIYKLYDDIRGETKKPTTIAITKASNMLSWIGEKTHLCRYNKHN